MKDEEKKKREERVKKIVYYVSNGRISNYITRKDLEKTRKKNKEWDYTKSK